MKSIGSAALAIFGCFFGQVAPCRSGPQEDQMVRNFEVFCLRNADDPDRVVSLAKAANAPELSAERAATLFKNIQGKRAFLIEESSLKAFLILTSVGGCSLVSTTPLDGLQIRQTIAESFKNIELTPQRMGTDELSTFAVSYPISISNHLAHIGVVLQRSTLSTPQPVVISAISESALAKIGRGFQAWPE